MADDTVTNELLLETLKRIQRDLNDVKRTIVDVREDGLATRRDVHAMRGELLRAEERAAEMALWRERVERRLDLRDD